jgi:hypothetical protein
MSRFRSVPRVGWFVAGVAVGFLMIPTAVGATVGVQTALKLTGIEGTSGNEADVSGAGQLLTTEAPPSSFFQGGTVNSFDGPTPNVLAQPTGNHALIISTIHYDVSDWLGPSGPPGVHVWIQPGPTCNENGISWDHWVTPPTVGETDVPFSPGLVVAKGDSLCIVAVDLSALVSVSGYLVPSADAPTSS